MLAAGRQRSFEPRRDRMALLGEPDRGLEQARPRQAAMLAMDERPHAQIARHADAASAGHGILMAQRRAVGRVEPARPGGGGAVSRPS